MPLREAPISSSTFAPDSIGSLKDLRGARSSSVKVAPTRTLMVRPRPAAVMQIVLVPGAHGSDAGREGGVPGAPAVVLVAVVPVAPGALT